MASKPTPEFRAETVRLALTGGLSRKQIAQDLKRFAINLIQKFGAKRSVPIDIVGVSKSSCVST